MACGKGFENSEKLQEVRPFLLASKSFIDSTMLLAYVERPHVRCVHGTLGVASKSERPLSHIPLSPDLSSVCDWLQDKASL